MATVIPQIDGTITVNPNGDTSIALATEGTYLDKNIIFNVEPPYCANPNILDNWYFENPINQRNFSQSSTANEFTIDRWRVYPNSSVSLSNGNFNVKGSIYQYLPYDSLYGKNITCSVLIEGNILEEATGTIPSSKPNEWIVYAMGTYIAVGGGNGWLEVKLGSFDTTKKIIAAKLEIGEKQTLAHKDSNGNWLLNEVPNFGDELRRCQRYYVNSAYCHSRTRNDFCSANCWSTTPARADVTFYFPAIMSSIPSVRYSLYPLDPSPLIWMPDGWESVDSYSFVYVGTDKGIFRLEKSGMSFGLNYGVRFEYEAIVSDLGG